MQQCLPDVTHQKMKTEWKILWSHPHAIHFMNCMTAVQFSNGTANHCHQVPISSHSVDLLPVGPCFVAPKPPTDVRQKVRYTLWGRLCKLCAYENCVNKNPHTQRRERGHSEGRGPLNHQCAPYGKLIIGFSKRTDQHWVQLLQRDTSIVTLTTTLKWIPYWGKIISVSNSCASVPVPKHFQRTHTL